MDYKILKLRAHLGSVRNTSRNLSLFQALLSYQGAIMILPTSERKFLCVSRFLLWEQTDWNFGLFATSPICSAAFLGSSYVVSVCLEAKPKGAAGMGGSS